MPKNIGYPKPTRKLPKDKILSRTSRADSLSSYSEFGSYVPPASRDSVRTARATKPSINPFMTLINAIKRKK